MNIRCYKKMLNLKILSPQSKIESLLLRRRSDSWTNKIKMMKISDVSLSTDLESKKDCRRLNRNNKISKSLKLSLRANRDLSLFWYLRRWWTHHSKGENLCSQITTESLRITKRGKFKSITQHGAEKALTLYSKRLILSRNRGSAVFMSSIKLSLKGKLHLTNKSLFQRNAKTQM